MEKKLHGRMGQRELIRLCLSGKQMLVTMYNQQINTLPSDYFNSPVRHELSKGKIPELLTNKYTIKAKSSKD